MFALFNPRTWLLIGLAVALAVSHGFAYRAGRAAVRADFDAYKIEQAEATAKAEADARSKEQALNIANRKVTNDYIAEKKRRAADAVVTAGKLRDLESALSEAASNPGTCAGTDDPRGTIAGECAAALSTLDEYAQGLAAKATALQEYTRSVRVSD